MLIITETTSGDTFRCNGVLIDRDVVLTSAICAEGADVVSVTAYAGLTNIATTGWQSAGAVTVAFPEGHSSGRDAFNVAMLILNEPFEVGPDVRPIPIATSAEVAAATGAVVSGYGGVNLENSAVNVLQSGSVNLIADGPCDAQVVEAYIDIGVLPAGSTTPYIRPATEVCAGGTGVGLCAFDDGAPLVIDAATSPKLVGVANFWPSCETGTPSVYADLSSDELYDFVALRISVPSLFTALTPVRVFDTRTAAAPSGAVLAGRTLDVKVAGVNGVPADATAVVLNVTGTQATRGGYVTVFPAGELRPLASSLNLAKGQTAPNMVIVPVGDSGSVSFFSSGGTHLLADVAGYFRGIGAPGGGEITNMDGSRLVSIPPSRLFDTRTSASPSGEVQGGSTLSVPVLGRVGVPASGVSAVVINLTGTQSRSGGFVTAFPSGANRPLASVLNFERSNDTTANLAIVPVGSNGAISLFSSTSAHLLGDVVGYMTDPAVVPFEFDGLFVPVSPSRLFDTRTPTTPTGQLAPGATVSVAHTGIAGIPNASVGAVSLNVTATNTTAGYVTGFPTGVARPLASTLNLSVSGETRANAAILPTGTNGRVSYFASGRADLLGDANGFFIVVN